MVALTIWAGGGAVAAMADQSLLVLELLHALGDLESCQKLRMVIGPLV
jgi:hypothetical protein